MKTLINYFKYRLGKENTMSSYLQMRNDYIRNKSNEIDKVCRLNGRLSPKYNISVSNGILGTLTQQKAEDIVSKINSDGYYIFPETAPQEIVKDLVKFASETPLNYMEATNTGVAFSKNTILYPQSKNQSNRHQFLDVSVFNTNKNILRLCTDENFLHIANEYLDTKPILDIVTMWWSNSLKQIETEKQKTLLGASAQMFHIDMDRLKFIKFFIYLTDVDTNTGPHVYVKGSHTKMASYLDADGRYPDELIEKNDKENIIEITGKAGSIIAVDTRGLHKGKELNDGERLIFQIEFTNSLFGKPEYPGIEKKYTYSGLKKYFNSYKLFFKN